MHREKKFLVLLPFVVSSSSSSGTAIVIIIVIVVIVWSLRGKEREKVIGKIHSAVVIVAAAVVWSSLAASGLLICVLRVIRGLQVWGRSGLLHRRRLNIGKYGAKCEATSCGWGCAATCWSTGSVELPRSQSLQIYTWLHLNARHWRRSTGALRRRVRYSDFFSANRAGVVLWERTVVTTRVYFLLCKTNHCVYL